MSRNFEWLVFGCIETYGTINLHFAIFCWYLQHHLTELSRFPSCTTIDLHHFGKDLQNHTRNMEDNEIDQTNICSTIDHDIATKEPAPWLPPQIGSYTRAASLTFTLDFSQRLYRMQDAARAQQSLNLRVSIQQKPERPNCGTRRSAVVALRIVIMSCFSVVFIFLCSEPSCYISNVRNTAL